MSVVCVARCSISSQSIRGRLVTRPPYPARAGLASKSSRRYHRSIQRPTPVVVRTQAHLRFGLVGLAGGRVRFCTRSLHEKIEFSLARRYGLVLAGVVSLTPWRSLAGPASALPALPLPPSRPLPARWRGRLAQGPNREHQRLRRAVSGRGAHERSHTHRNRIRAADRPEGTGGLLRRSSGAHSPCGRRRRAIRPRCCDL